MRLVRLYADERGEACFEDLNPELRPDGASEVAVLRRATASVSLRRMIPGHEAKRHNAPQRQFVVVLEGRMEIEVSGGKRRRFGPGDILLVEDVTGTGHITRTLGSTPRMLLNIPVEAP